MCDCQAQTYIHAWFNLANGRRVRYPAATARWGAPRQEVRRRHCRRRIGSACIAVLRALPPPSACCAAMPMRLVVLDSNGCRSWYGSQRRARQHTAATAAIHTGADTWPSPRRVLGWRSVRAHGRVLLTAVHGADGGRRRGQAHTVPPSGAALWRVALLPLLRSMLLQPQWKAGPQAGTKRAAVCVPTAPTALQQASELPSARRPTRCLPPHGA